MLINIPVKFHDSRSNTFELRATQKRTDGRRDRRKWGRMDMGESKCPPLKWGNNKKYFSYFSIGNWYTKWIRMKVKLLLCLHCYTFTTHHVRSAFLSSNEIYLTCHQSNVQFPNNKKYISLQRVLHCIEPYKMKFSIERCIFGVFTLII
jgi:hypothetical protein